MNNIAAKIATFVGEEFFATALAEHIFKHYYDANNPSCFAELVVFLPTRRACHSMKYELFKRAGSQNLILPKLTTISDLNLLDFIPITHEYWQTPPQNIIGSQQRLFLVAHFLHELAQKEAAAFNHPLNFSTAMQYAQSFLELRDDFLRTKIKLEDLQQVIIGEYAQHWLNSLSLFERVMQWLELTLKEKKLVEPIQHTQIIIETLCEYWRNNPHQKPIIAAGSTGSAPSTAELLKAIYELPNGSLILRELDVWIDEEEFKATPPTHYAYNLKQLLARLKVERNEVMQLQYGQSKRGELTSVMLHTQNKLHETSVINAENMHGIEWLECENDAFETEVICLKVRQALSDGMSKILIISDDDGLNMRIKAILSQYDLKVDIAAGIAAHHHVQYNFMLLVAQTLFSDYNSADLLSLLRHKACTYQQNQMRLIADFMEEKMLRKRHSFENMAQVLQALMQHSFEPELDAALEVLEQIAELAGAITHKMNMQEMIILHRKIWLLLNPSGESDYNHANALLEQNLSLSAANIIIAPHEYLSILQQQCALVREIEQATDAHVTIIGALELRLQVADLLIMPRCNDGVFPKSPSPDPWLNNDLRRHLGLNYFERKIGLAAHDMAIMLRFPRVLFTRSFKERDAFTNSSPLFERLKLLANYAKIPAAKYLHHWALQLQNQPLIEAKPLAINPPLQYRPRKISATMCEDFFSNPFKVYVNHICKLRELDPLDDELRPLHFGNALHAALHKAASYYNPHELSQYLQVLREIFNAELVNLVPHDEAQFHAARLKRILSTYEREELLRAPMIEKLKTEAKYSAKFALSGGSEIELNARIDRIERRVDGALCIIDHKTGTPPSIAAVASYEKCQLLVNKLIMEINGAEIASLEYWNASGKYEAQNKSIVSDITAQADAKNHDFSTDAIAQRLRDILSYFIENELAIYDYRAAKRKFANYDAIAHFARNAQAEEELEE